MSGTLDSDPGVSSRRRAADVFHGSENDAPVAPLQLLHERQVVADPETPDWLLLKEETGTKTWSILVLIKKKNKTNFISTL